MFCRLKRDKLYDGGFADFSKKIILLELSEKESKFERLLYDGPKILSSSQSRKIQEFIEENNIQIAHFHYGTDCGIFFPATKKIKIPSVVSFYGYDCSSFPKYMMGYGKKYLINRVFKRITAILAMSPDMKNELLNAGCPEEKIIVHYYGTDCRKFYHVHQYPKKEKIIILILSHLCHKKGHVFLFKSLKKVIESGIYNFEMRVVGTGEMENELHQLVKEIGLEKHIVFLGALKYASQEMMDEYQNADIFVHPSVVAPNGDKEGIPGTIIEAMSAGLPVVSTFHAGIPYVIENQKTGLLVKEWDIEALTHAISQLILNRNMREKTGIAAQKFALNNLDLIRKENELEKIYDRLQ